MIEVRDVHRRLLSQQQRVILCCWVRVENGEAVLRFEHFVRGDLSSDDPSEEVVLVPSRRRLSQQLLRRSAPADPRSNRHVEALEPARPADVLGRPADVRWAGGFALVEPSLRLINKMPDPGLASEIFEPTGTDH